ncbi:MAG: radical SAM protein [Christensenellaceae bacterium]
MNICSLCPNACNVDRTENLGYCKTSDKLKIAKYSLHPYEEPPISGKNGSGTIFFTGCSLRCVFCQNYDVSRNNLGKEITVKELGEIFKKLEDMGAHNINLVNPTHYSLKIIQALDLYRPKIPIVWNTHGYEKVETLKTIDDYVDIYLTDFKYCSSKVSVRYTLKSDYFEVAKAALDFMLNKKPVIEDGLMKRGVIIRHLILPLNTSDSVAILEYLKSVMRNGAYLSLMSQYTPFGEIDNFPELKRPITKREYNKVFEKLCELDFQNVFLQDDSSSSQKYIPDWDF